MKEERNRLGKAGMVGRFSERRGKEGFKVFGAGMDIWQVGG